MKILGILDPVVKQMQIYRASSSQFRGCSQMNFCVPNGWQLSEKFVCGPVSQGRNPVIYQRKVFIKWQTFNLEFQYETFNTSFHIMFVTVCFQMINSLLAIKNWNYLAVKTVSK